MFVVGLGHDTTCSVPVVLPGVILMVLPIELAEILSPVLGKFIYAQSMV